MVLSNPSPLTADASPFSRGLEEAGSGIVWQGRYQYFVASSSSIRDERFNTTLEFVTNETSRSWPLCGDCYEDEVRVPLGEDGLALSIISDSSSYVIGPGGGFPNLNLDVIREGGSQSEGFYTETAIGLFTGGSPYFVAPDGYDGWSCDSVTMGAVPERGTWTATDLVVGFHQEQGYCPDPKRIYRPCKNDELCTIVNREQTCTFVGDEARDRHAKLLEHFECPENIPSGAKPELGLGKFSRDSEGGVRLRQQHTFLQADSYEFLIMDETPNATHTQVEFPSFPHGFWELSLADYEIFNVWGRGERWNGEETERRFTMQFERKQYGPRLTSRDGWDLTSSWVYDNLPDWTEWNADDNETDIQVPTGYSLFACERVEFDYTSTYTGGSPARIVFKNFLLGAHLSRNYNVCHPDEMPIYHPCLPTETCLAKNGVVSCIPIEGIGEEIPVAQSRAAVTTTRIDLPAANDDRFRDWLDCGPYRKREKEPNWEDSGSLSGSFLPFVTASIVSTLILLVHA